MRLWMRARNLALQIPRYFLLACGLWFLLRNALYAFGGPTKLWLFERIEPHRFTSMAMLTGTLRLRGALSKVQSDEQVFNGAGYTNWGFGVPILQMPFHAIAPKLHWIAQRFFPDRAIYFFYFALLVPILWAAFDRLLATRERPGSSRVHRHVVSWAATLVVLTSTLYPLMSCRFVIYEETVCYFIVAELLALAAYILSLRRWGVIPLFVMGVAAGFGLLIRPTGLPYLLVWVAALLLERRSLKVMLAFGLGALPLVVFWAYSNDVRSGSPIAFGLSNSSPWWDYHTPMLRFGSLCANTPKHAAQAAKALFKAFFANTGGDPPEWLKKCHFSYEERPVPGGGSGAHEAFFGATVLVLLAWTFLHTLARRERRLVAYLPFAALAALFCVYVRGSAGFVWRYAGDFWPLIIMALALYVRFLPVGTTRRFAIPGAIVMLLASWSIYVTHVEPSTPTIETLDPNDEAHMWDDFTNSRYSSGDPPMPSHIKCGQFLSSPFHNGLGWNTNCSVSTFSNVYLGVPEKGTDDYEVRFKTQGIDSPTLRVYVNGRIYTAYREGTGYFTKVHISQKDLTTWAVLVTIEWVRSLDPPTGKLLSIELA